MSNLEEMVERLHRRGVLDSYANEVAAELVSLYNQFQSAAAAASEYSEFWEKHHGDFDQFGNYIPYSQMDGDLRAAKTEIERLRGLIPDLAQAVPEWDRTEADKQDIWDAWSVVDAFGRETMLDSTDGHAAIVHAIRYGRYGAKPTRTGFERLLESLKYDGADINSLTVGEIRRALP